MNCVFNVIDKRIINIIGKSLVLYKSLKMAYNRVINTEVLTNHNRLIGR